MGFIVLCLAVPLSVCLPACLSVLHREPAERPNGPAAQLGVGPSRLAVGYLSALSPVRLLVCLPARSLEAGREKGSLCSTPLFLSLFRTRRENHSAVFELDRKDPIGVVVLLVSRYGGRLYPPLSRR